MSDGSSLACQRGSSCSRANSRKYWLWADLARYAEFVNKGPDQARAAVTKTLRHWQQDTDFAGVRGDGLAKLPESERQLWQNLWAEVEALRQRTTGQPVPKASDRH